MALFKCKMCGGNLTLVEGQTVAECEYCGRTQTVPAADNEKKLTLFARANRLRAACEFDKAAGIYESIVADFSEEAEAYWGLVLCKYGIEYVDDPGTGKKIPTCHRSSFDSVMEDSDYEQALENADSLARKVYREEAKQIEEIRKGIISVSSNEQPYDIFICYKETDDTGDRTLDSVLAQDIYDALTDKGYRVFFARITLEDKLGQEYEPYIFAALNSAKIMLAIGTDYEYYNAVWVKNEWSRFLKLMANDKDKHLIPCYKGIDAYDMPKEFSKLQAQDLGKVGAIQDLLRGIAKILTPQEKSTVADQQLVVNTNAMVMRGQFALDDGNWAKADEYFERALDQNPEDAKAYVGKVLAGLRLSTVEQIDDHFVELEGNKNFERAIKFSDDADREQLLKTKEFADRKWLIKKFTVGLKTIAEKQELEAVKKEIQKQEEEKRKKIAENRVRLESIRKKNAPASNMIAAGSCIVGLRADGTVVATGNNNYDQCNVSHWTDIVAISAYDRQIVGLRADGTVVAEGNNRWDQCNVSHWKDIVAISAGNLHTVGLRANGTVVARGYQKDSRCSLFDWKDIVAIAAGYDHTVGLRADGTVVATSGYIAGRKVFDWTDIVAIAAGGDRLTVGLRADGTVVVESPWNFLREAESDWTDIVAIAAYHSHIVGLRADGTVVEKSDMRCEFDVSDWKDIVAISAGDRHIVGLRADGTVVVTRDTEFHFNVPDVTDWKLFENYENLNQEREKARQKLKEKRKAAMQELEKREQEKALRRLTGLCQHCGGRLKGFFNQKCTQCGKPKDY